MELNENIITCIVTKQVKKLDGFIYLKAALDPSLSVNKTKHTEWLLLKENNVVVHEA